MSITDPQFGEENQQIAGAIDVFGSSSNFIGDLDDIISGRNLINDIINADLVDINVDGSLNFDPGSGMSLADQIEAEVTTMQADNALAQMEEQLNAEVAEIQANNVLSDQEKKVRIAQLADNWLDQTGAPNSVKAEVMTSVWNELGHDVTLTAEGYDQVPQAYGVRTQEGGFIDLSDPVVTDSAGGGGSTSDSTVTAGTPAAGGGSVTTTNQADAASSAASAAAAATANDPNAAAAQAAVDAAMAGANQDAGDNRDIVTDADGTVWVNTGGYPTAPNVNGWVTNNPSAGVIADYEAQTGNTYVGGPLTIGLPEGQFPASGTANAGDGAGDGIDQNNQNNQDNQNDQDGNGLLENAAAILGGLSAAVLNNADPYDVTSDNTNNTNNTDGTGSSNTTTTLGDCPEGQMRSPYSGNCVTDYSQVDFTNNGNSNTDETGNDGGNDGTGTCPPGTKLAGQAKPADGNCNPGDGDDVCGAGTKLAGQLVPEDGNCNPGSGEGLGTDLGTGGTGGGSGGTGDVYNLFTQTARTPAALSVLENRGLDYELTPLLSRVLNI